MSQFMACHETGTWRLRLIPVGQVAKVEPQDPARPAFAPTTITLKSGKQVHVTEQPATVRDMSYTPLWMVDA